MSDLYYTPDNKKYLLGTSKDAEIYYNGTDFVIDPRKVGSGSLVVGSGAAGVDYAIKVNGETNDGVLTWMEDEDYFAFSDDILMNTTENIYLRDTAISINSATDGHLDLTADTSIDLNANVNFKPGTKSDGKVIKSVVEVQTTDATVTTVDSITLLDENTYQIEAWVIGVQSDGSNRASYKLIGTFYRTGAGNAALQGSATTLHTEESDVNWDANFTVSGNDVRVSVTGVAATTIEWCCTLRYLNMSN